MSIIELGHGTTINIYLPLAEPTETGLSPTARAPKKGTASILIVDDERLLRRMAADVLQNLGYETTSCEDGNEAIEYYRKSWEQIDLVLLDMIMPGKSGKETFLAMQEINPNIKVILISGYSLSQQVEDILDAGVKGFIHKPFSQVELSEKVEQVLGEA